MNFLPNICKEWAKKVIPNIYLPYRVDTLKEADRVEKLEKYGILRDGTYPPIKFDYDAMLVDFNGKQPNFDDRIRQIKIISGGEFLKENKLPSMLTHLSWDFNYTELIPYVVLAQSLELGLKNLKRIQINFKYSNSYFSKPIDQTLVPIFRKECQTIFYLLSSHETLESICITNEHTDSKSPDYVAGVLFKEEIKNRPNPPHLRSIKLKSVDLGIGFYQYLSDENCNLKTLKLNLEKDINMLLDSLNQNQSIEKLSLYLKPNFETLQLKNYLLNTHTLRDFSLKYSEPNKTTFSVEAPSVTSLSLAGLEIDHIESAPKLIHLSLNKSQTLNNMTISKFFPNLETLTLHLQSNYPRNMIQSLLIGIKESQLKFALKQNITPFKRYPNQYVKTIQLNHCYFITQ
eukprot:gene9358-11492_t